MIELIDTILDHAGTEAPRECCGLIVDGRYVPCRNNSPLPGQFVMHPADYASAEEAGQITYIVHSHHQTSPEPSQADLVMCERSRRPWLIVSHPTGAYRIINPSGYRAPLEGRTFAHGILDCASLVSDYYDQVLGISIEVSEHEPQWWLNKKDYFVENYERCGFVRYPADTPLQIHDVILMQIGAQVPNHAAIYVGNQRILQHCSGHLSGYCTYGGMWQQHASGIFRHRKLLEGIR